MNHRQWKKNFKKTHGRNPYMSEDKKKSFKAFMIAYPELGKTLKDFAENFTKALGRVYQAIGDIFVTTGEAMKEIGKAVEDD